MTHLRVSAGRGIVKIRLFAASAKAPLCKGSSAVGGEGLSFSEDDATDNPSVAASRATSPYTGEAYGKDAFLVRRLYAKIRLFLREHQSAPLPSLKKYCSRFADWFRI